MRLPNFGNLPGFNALRPAFARTDADLPCSRPKRPSAGRSRLSRRQRPAATGVGGATMASAEFDESIEEKRPTVCRSATRFHRKNACSEACLELMRPVAGHRHSGHGGLRASPARAVEMGAKRAISALSSTRSRAGDARSACSAYEMNAVGKPGAPCSWCWNLRRKRSPRRLRQMGARLRHCRQDHRPITQVPHPAPGRRKSPNLPIKELGDEAPEYNREWRESAASPRFNLCQDVEEPEDYDPRRDSTSLGSANNAFQALGLGALTTR